MSRKYPKSLDRSVLLVIDMQNGTCRPNGSLSKAGLDISSCLEIIPKLKKLVDVWRNHNLPIIFTRYVLLPNFMDIGLLREVFPKFESVGHALAGTWDAEIIDELKPALRDYVIDKARYSAFYNTNLENILHGLHAENLFFTGVTTNICVESSLRDAFIRDYHVTLIEDCTAAVDNRMKEATISTVKYGFGSVISTEEIYRIVLDV